MKDIVLKKEKEEIKGIYKIVRDIRDFVVFITIVLFLSLFIFS